MAVGSKITEAVPSASRRADTPPSSPTLPLSGQAITVENVREFMDLLKVWVATQAIPTPVGAPPAVKNSPPKEARLRASKLEYKTVDEVWDATALKYKTAESSTPSPGSDEFDEYIFVARMRIDKRTEDATYFIDIKSEGLRDILKSIMQDVKGTCLKEDKPTVERNLLYHFLVEMEAYRSAAENSTVHDPSYLDHLALLIDYIKSAYASTTQRIISLLESGEITYDLLWALFKPNDIVYGKCLGTRKSRCIKYDFGEKKTGQDDNDYFRIEGRYLDFNGKEFGEALTAVPIFKFRGSKPIHSLAFFPLKYHPSADEEKQKLITCGWKFIRLMGVHHQQYKGEAFYMEKGKPIKVFVDGRIMIDAALFRELNPNYIRPSIDEMGKYRSKTIWISFSESQLDKVKSNDMDPAKLSNDDVLLCSPTVLGFSLSDKYWLEFAVDDISAINWNPLPFQRLAIPQKRKSFVRAVAAYHTTKATSRRFDDYVAGKGRGLIILLHGPPGVGKTLTAEALSEELRKPLYMVSSGELVVQTKEVEEQLTRIFRQADHWNAMLLLDEADVFMRQRSLDYAGNGLITLFLHKLEHYKGIMFLTTNRVIDFDEAMHSRIHISLKYPALGVDTRRELWKSFLEIATEGKASFSDRQLNNLAEKELNGRQIKNAVKVALASASEYEVPVSYSDLETVLELAEEFDCDFKGPGRARNLYC